MVRSPFYPAIDPFVESSRYWEGYHDVVVTECMYDIERQLPQGYVSNVQERAEVISAGDPAAKVYVPDIGVAREVAIRPVRGARPAGGVEVADEVRWVTIPSPESVEIRENYVEIYKEPDLELVTVVELLSPWNKNGAGVEIYRAKRAKLVKEGVHVVELDLLRRGTRTALAAPLPPADYYAMVFRADRVPDVEVSGWGLAEPVPAAVRIPLRAPDPDLRLDLRAVLATAYERGRYDRKLRYDRPLDPPLEGTPADWIRERLAGADR